MKSLKEFSLTYSFSALDMGIGSSDGTLARVFCSSTNLYLGYTFNFNESSICFNEVEESSDLFVPDFLLKRLNLDYRILNDVL